SVRPLRPHAVEPFLRLSSFPAEQAQVDWADFGAVKIGRAMRRLSCFVMTLSYSRALFLEFFFDQSQESFLRGHVRAFAFFQGAPRVVLYDYVARHIVEVLCPLRLCAAAFGQGRRRRWVTRSWAHNGSERGEPPKECLIVTPNGPSAV